MYALFFIFLVTPTFSSVKATTVGLIIALAAKTIILMGGYSIYAVSTVFSNEIWFVLVMSICTFNVQLKGRKVQRTICGLLFMILSVVVYKAEISGGVIPFAMGLLACVAVILMVAGGEKKVWQRHGFSCKIHNADFSDDKNIIYGHNILWIYIAQWKEK